MRDEKKKIIKMPYEFRNGVELLNFQKDQAAQRNEA